MYNKKLKFKFLLQPHQEDGEFVVSHGQNGGDEECLVPQLRDQDHGERLHKTVQESLVLRRVELRHQQVVIDGGVQEEGVKCRRFMGVVAVGFFRFRQIASLCKKRE